VEGFFYGSVWDFWGALSGGRFSLGFVWIECCLNFLLKISKIRGGKRFGMRKILSMYPFGELLFEEEHRLKKPLHRFLEYCPIDILLDLRDIVIQERSSPLERTQALGGDAVVFLQSQ